MLDDHHPPRDDHPAPLTAVELTGVQWVLAYMIDTQLCFDFDDASAVELAAAQHTLAVAVALRGALDSGSLPVDVDQAALVAMVAKARDEAVETLTRENPAEDREEWQRALESIRALLEHLDTPVVLS